MFYAIYGFKITLEEGKIKCDCPALDDDSGQKAVLIGIIEASTDEGVKNRLGLRLMPLDHRISLQNKGTKQGQKLYFPACLGDFNTIFLAMQDMLKKQKKGRMLYNAVDVYGYKIEPVKLLGASDVNPFKDWKQPE